MVQSQITVVGGGVIGLSIAWELVNRGLTVRLLNRDASQQRTSWTAAGILPPANLDHSTDPIDRLRGLSHQMYPSWVKGIEAASGIDCGLRRCGGWYLADSAGERAAMIGMQSYWQELGIECEPVSADAIADRLPALTHWVKHCPRASAWWTPDEWQIRPPWYLRSLEAACRKQGVQIDHGCDVETIDIDSPYPRVRAGGQWIESEKIVLAAGAWTGQVSEVLGLQISLIPIRGQMLLLQAATGLIEPIINVGQRYLVPREDGRILVGSCEEEAGFQRGTTEAALSSLREFAIELIPELADAPIEHSWSGLRPMTFDGFPMIGRLPGKANVYVAAGHFRSGIHLAPATARCLADQLTGEPPIVSLDAFSVGKQQSQPNH